MENHFFKSMEEAAKKYEINISTVRARMKRGWSIKQALGLDSKPNMTSKRYIVTSPKGTEIYVENFSEFARQNGFPDDGRKLRRVATAKNLHSWHGWKIRGRRLGSAPKNG